MGAEYTLDDFRRQLDLLRQQGRHALLDSGLLDFADEADDLPAKLELMERIIDAMTAQERHDPDRVGISRRCELARRGRERAEAVYGWPIVAQQHIDFFERVIARRRV